MRSAPGQGGPRRLWGSVIVSRPHDTLVRHVHGPHAAVGEFLQALPSERIAYSHIAGHYNEAEDLIVDTHGADIIDPVWSLLDKAYETFGVFPTLLERDFNIPEIPVLLKEVDQISRIQEKWQPDSAIAHG